MLRKFQSIYWYLGIGFILAMGAIVSLVTIAAGMVNTESQNTQQDIARYITKSRYESAEQRLMPMIYWQDAYNRMSRGWDKHWIQWEFGKYLDSLQINAALLFDNQGRLIQMHQNGIPKPLSGEEIHYSENVLNLLDAIRAAPRTTSPPPIRTAMVQLNGMQFFAAAGRISPEDAGTLVGPDKDITVIFLVHATAASYQALFDGFHLQGVEITADNTVVPGKAGMILHDLDNDEVGRLWWTPYRPSVRFTKVVVPWTILVFVLFALLQFAVLRRWQAAQRELSRAQAKAEAALEESRAKSAFIGTISHELRTPLNAIIGFSELLTLRLFGPLGAEQYGEYAQHIHASGTSLLSIVNDVIEISRIQGRDTGLDCARCDAALLVGDAIQKMRGAAGAKNIKLVSAAGAEPLWCTASPQSLTHSITRLLDNAIKFSPCDSSVAIDMQVGDGVTIAIRDNGIGIDDERLATIGQPFVQAEGHLARSNGGIGLGLAISRGLVELMGGTLTVASALGAGTTITLRLPPAEAPEEVKIAA